MKLISIKIKDRGVSTTDALPESFILEGMEYFISEAEDRWYQGENDPDFPEADYFRVRTRDGSSFLVRHELKSGKWHIVL